jgi:hypothetical protein
VRCGCGHNFCFRCKQVETHKDTSVDTQPQPPLTALHTTHNTLSDFTSCSFTCAYVPATHTQCLDAQVQCIVSTVDIERHTLHCSIQHTHTRGMHCHMQRAHAHTAHAAVAVVRRRTPQPCVVTWHNGPVSMKKTRTRCLKYGFTFVHPCCSVCCVQYPVP